MDQELDALLGQAISAVRAGHKEEAKRLLVEVLRIDSQNEAAWLWMSAAVDTRAERVHCLKQILNINPENETAIKGLRSLGALEVAQSTLRPQPEPEPEIEEEAAQAEPAAEALVEPEPEPEPPAPVDLAPGGVPLPGPEAITRVQRQADAAIEAIGETMQPPTGPTIRWGASRGGGGLAGAISVPKRVRLSINPMILAIAGAAVLVVLAVVLVSTLVSGLRDRRAAAVPAGEGEVAETATPMNSAAEAATPRPTRTPTPPGQSVEEPMLSIEDAPRGDLRFGLTPTAPYVGTPHPSQPTLLDAIDAYHEGRYTEALDQMQQAQAALDSLPIDALYYEGLIRHALGQDAQAIDALEEGIRQNGTFAPLHAALANVYFSQSDYANARREAELARDLDPRLVDGYLTLADVALAEGNYEEALAHVDAGRASHKHDVNLLVKASEIYATMGDADNAVAYAKLAQYIDPSSEEVVLALGRARLTLGYNELAAIGLEDYLYLTGESSAAAWGLLGQAYTRLNRSEDAQEAFARALSIDPNMVSALAGRAELNLQSGDELQAYDDLTSALEVDPTDRAIRLTRARTAYALGRYEIAASDFAIYRQAASYQPDAEIELMYVNALAQDGQLPELVSAASMLLDTPPERLELTAAQRAELYELRANAYYETSRYDEALADAEQALAIGETASRRFLRAQVRYQLGLLQDAADDLQWVIDNASDPALTGEARLLLADVAVQLTPSPTPTVTATVTVTPSITPSPTMTRTPTPTVTPTLTRTPSPTPSRTPRPTRTPRP